MNLTATAMKISSFLSLPLIDDVISLSESKINLIDVKHRIIDPMHDAVWYPVAFDGKDLFWGLAKMFTLEFGTFSLTELNELKAFLDGDFKPKTLFRCRSELKTSH